MDKAQLEMITKMVEEIAGEAAVKTMLTNQAKGLQMFNNGQFEQPKPKTKNSARIGASVKMCIDKRRGQFSEKSHANSLVMKSMKRTDFALGGSLIPDGFANEIIEGLHEVSTVRSLGARTIEMPTGSLSIPALGTGVSGGYVGEAVAKNAETIATKMVTLNAKKLIALVPVSNDFVRSADATDGQMDMLGNDIIEALAAVEDLYFIRGNSGPTAPKGLHYQAIAANQFAITHAAAIATDAEMRRDLLKVQYYVRNGLLKNVVNGGWIMAPRSEFVLKSSLTSNGVPYYPEMMAGTLFGMPYRSTTAVPINLNTDESFIIFADFSKVLIGDAKVAQIELLENAAYNNSSGTVVSGASADTSVIRVISEHDITTRHGGVEVGVLTGVDWA